MAKDESIICHSPEGDTWSAVPQSLRYIRPWVTRFGVRGLTIHYGEPSLAKLASPAEMPELRTAYEEIAKRDDALAISAWCQSEDAQRVNDLKESIRGLLLLFERIAEFALEPFSDARVRYRSTALPWRFDWSVLPNQLRSWEPWLQKYEGLRSEGELYSYVDEADSRQLRELEFLKEQLQHGGDALRAWCVTSNVAGHPAQHEAFQAEWLFVLVDFLEQ